MEFENKPSVLIIDDDETFGEILARTLARRGFEVQVAINGEEALSLATSESPEYVVLDLKLGQESGLPLVTQLKQIDPQTKIVVLTGYASIATAIEAIKLGATHYLAKPTDADTVVQAFQRDDSGDAATPIVNNRPSVERLEWEYLQQVLTDHSGNISATARALNMHRRTLQRKLSKRPYEPM